jgi:Flp pilus assembly protein CpaB
VELKLKRIGAKYLLPAVSFTALFAAIIIAGLNLSFPQESQTVLQAKANIAAGETITESKLEIVSVPLGSLRSLYLSEFQEGVIANSSIFTGELLPKSALAKELDVRVPVRINNLPQISKSIKIGDRVDVWASSLNNSQPIAPEPVVFGAIVLAIENSSSMAQITTSVELRIDPAYLEPLLLATDSNYKISLILQETLKASQ